MNTPSKRPHTIKLSRDTQTIAVGYIRLSIEKQARGDTEFEKQAESIRKSCARRGITLIEIYEDTWSGADPLGVHRRNGLLDAVKRAREENALLVVTEPTRLFRHVDAARDFLKTLDVPVLSVREGRILKPRALLNAISRGEVSVQNIRNGTSDALAQRTSAGVDFSDSAVRSRAAKASAKSRAEKANGIVHQIADVLLSDPAYRTLTHKALAELLNRRKLLTGWDRPWTHLSVRSARKKAEDLIQEWADAETWADEPPLTDNMPQRTKVPAQVKSDKSPAEKTDDLAEMRKLPTFGMF